jgi:hypothetical protein
MRYEACCLVLVGGVALVAIVAWRGGILCNSNDAFVAEGWRLQTLLAETLLQDKLDCFAHSKRWRLQAFKEGDDAMANALYMY